MSTLDELAQVVGSVVVIVVMALLVGASIIVAFRILRVVGWGLLIAFIAGVGAVDDAGARLGLWPSSAARLERELQAHRDWLAEYQAEQARRPSPPPPIASEHRQLTPKQWEDINKLLDAERPTLPPGIWSR